MIIKNVKNIGCLIILFLFIHVKEIVAPAAYCQDNELLNDITFTTECPVSVADITITGRSASSKTIFTAKASSRHYAINAAKTLSLTYIELKGGDKRAGDGGSIAITAGGTFICNHCAFTSNSARTGGAIFSNHVSATITLTDVLFSSNTATIAGGAMCIENEIH